MLESISKHVAESVHCRPSYIRAGQAAFNCLAVIRKEWAEEIRGTDLDPFYTDRRLPAFWEWLAEKEAGR